MNTPLPRILNQCSEWGIWSYRLPLRRPLAVLGHTPTVRKGWIIGRFNPSIEAWQLAEVAPLPSFHQVSYADVYTDLVNILKHQHPPTMALTNTPFDIWNLSPQRGFLSYNALLGSKEDPVPSQTTIKVKLGRHALQDEIKWFTHLQTKHPQVRWRLDCNRQWTLEQLTSFWAHCIPERIAYFEEPLAQSCDLRQCPDIPIALDESLEDHPDLLGLPNVIAMVIKPTLHQNWIDLIQNHPNKQAIFSSTFEGSLGLWGLGQLALHYAPDQTHGLGTLDWFAQECVSPSLTFIGDQMRLDHPPLPNWNKLTLDAGQ